MSLSRGGYLSGNRTRVPLLGTLKAAPSSLYYETRYFFAFRPKGTSSFLIICREDLDLLSSAGGAAQWLAEVSEGWIGFWEKRIGKSGFHPFDCLAVGYVAMPSRFTWETIPVRVRWRKSRFVERSALQVSHDFSDTCRVTYCFDVDPQFKTRLISRLTRNP